MINPVIHTSRLTRYFGNRPVVRDLDIVIPAGQVTALLGLNGAGKTTTIRIIMGLLRPTRGTAFVWGENTAVIPTETRRRIGYLVEGHFLYSWMTVDQCSSFQRAGYSHWDDRLFDQIVRHFAISAWSKIGELSRGQRAGWRLPWCWHPIPSYWCWTIQH